MNSDQGTIIQLTLADAKAVQDDIKADLANWCNSIKDKIKSINKKQSRILKSMANNSKWVEGLHVAAKEIESQVGKVTNALDMIANTATPYWDALLKGPGRIGKETVDSRI